MNEDWLAELVCWGFGSVYRVALMSGGSRRLWNQLLRSAPGNGYECKSCETPSKIGFIPGPSPGWHSGGSSDDALVRSTHKYSSMPSIPFGTVVPRRKSDVVTEID
ncbi:hypothetical protein ALC57_02502 [Trachymyrmex cornetzi]|uniref:Uncharacterized protein n=1 Tax=Trachymyrmex cornetzi TaxID=471704 RepID=A0A195EIS3_9HYME|nr:hypothetical protein ALC57_02502 [Trachymyrmex cornetzi]